MHIPSTATGQQLNQGQQLTTKVLPVLSVERITNLTKEQSSTAKAFNLGQVYQGKVQEQVGKDTHLVKVEQQLLKMQLGQSVKPGETLALRYIKTQPVPTFLLEQNNPAGSGDARLSQAAQLITKLLQQAQASGASNRFQAQDVVTQQPLLVAQTAQALKQSIGKTGLFYESNLRGVLQGDHEIEQLKQAPQNTQNQLLSTVVSQQLSLLETQKFAWSGEIWPGQVMQMDIAPVSEDAGQDQQDDAQDKSEQAVESVLTLDLPKLGKVKVQLNLRDEHLSVRMQAAKPETKSAMREQKARLQTALNQHVDAVDALTVNLLTDQVVSGGSGYRPVTKVDD